MALCVFTQTKSESLYNIEHINDLCSIAPARQKQTNKKKTRCNFIQNISKDVRFIQVHKQKAINAIKFRKQCVLYCEE